MFNDKFNLTAAVLNRTKTKIRQIVTQKALDAWNNIDDGDEYSRSVYADSYYAKMHNFLLKYAQYKVGDVVAVAQSYCETCHGDCLVCAFHANAGCTNKMFVKADCMPHRIEITNIRVERLQDISDDDCIAEGIIKEHVRLEYDEPQDTVRYRVDESTFPTPRAAYAALIDKISGKGMWERNPWVYCYTFKLVK